MKLANIIPLLTVAVAGLLGYMSDGARYLPVVLGLALVNAFVLARPRLEQARRDASNPKPNVIAEGAFLLVAQLLILGGAYLVGFLFGNAVPVIR